LSKSDAKQIRLEIRDDGRGIPQKRLKRLVEDASEAGVGIAGMRERMRDLGGTLNIQSSRTGTSVVISIPAEKAFATSQENGESGQSVSAA